ncbi:hypothetical protein [Burkholderia gladioli]|uniref:hypothetical protein n=1 Tax=Burkholderia gladioli TaxID=28095 RepID=UPI00163E0436|nr:hypothetical protein [Burkholderia gladioli]
MTLNSKSFGLSGPSDYYDKLEWEFERLMKAGNATGRELAFHAINLAITGWHMTDWTFNFLPVATKASHSNNSATFQAWVKSQSRVIAACREVATAGKHMQITRGPDPAISTFSEGYVEEGYWEDAYCESEWKILIDGQSFSLDNFGREVINFWQCFLNSEGLL